MALDSDNRQTLRLVLMKYLKQPSLVYSPLIGHLLAGQALSLHICSHTVLTRTGLVFLLKVIRSKSMFQAWLFFIQHIAFV